MRIRWALAFALLGVVADTTLTPLHAQSTNSTSNANRMNNTADVQRNIDRASKTLSDMVSLLNQIEARKTSGGAASLRSFWFDYAFEPQPGRRTWKHTSDDTWQEIYPNGQITLFRVIDHLSVENVPGTVVESLSNPGFTVFIPNAGAGNAWLRFRSKGETKWNYLAEIKGE